LKSEKSPGLWNGLQFDKVKMHRRKFKSVAASDPAERPQGRFVVPPLAAMDLSIWRFD